MCAPRVVRCSALPCVCDILCSNTRNGGLQSTTFHFYGKQFLKALLVSLCYYSTLLHFGTICAQCTVCICIVSIPFETLSPKSLFSELEFTVGVPFSRCVLCSLFNNEIISEMAQFIFTTHSYARGIQIGMHFDRIGDE